MKLAAITSMLLALMLAWPLFGQSEIQRKPQDQLGREEEEDYFRRWLREDVLYIITPDEAAVFGDLGTIEERERFVEQFWFRRDPDPRTSHNEFKEEHYRRIAYANEIFTSGFPGWKTDRGLIYIKYGPPDFIERNPTGGDYQRPAWEGGGSTTTFPFERWEYRRLEDVGQDIEIEFVDDTLTGEYRLTTNAQDKDALLYVANAGLTSTEMLGLVNQKIDRIVQTSNPMPWSDPLSGGSHRARDQPFEKLQLVTNLERAPAIDYTDLKARVLTEVRFNDLPMQMRTHVFRVGGRGRALLTLYMQRKDLTLKQVGETFQGEVQIYALVTNLGGRIVKEISDSMRTVVPAALYLKGGDERLVYQRDILLNPGRYKLEVFVEDPAAERVGSSESLVVIPGVGGDELQLSSLLLASRIEAVAASDDADLKTRFKIWPADGARLPNNDSKLGFYYEVYNFTVDQATGQPQVDLNYNIVSADGTPLQATPKYHSADVATGRLMVVSILELVDLQPGNYQLTVELHDRISDQRVSRTVEFEMGE